MKQLIHNFIHLRPDSATVRLQSANGQISDTAYNRPTSQSVTAYQNSIPNYTFQFQSLIEPDKHVLQSIEKSLTEPGHPSVLLHSCNFFNAVLINDFSPEIFLQRPKIVVVSL